jgi:hypothetical protein
MRAIALASALALSLAGPALADGPITTAPVAGPTAPPSTPPPAALPPPVGAAPGEGPRIALGPCGPEKVKPDGSLETQPHGEVDASVGTNGYRRVGGSVCQPIGQDGFVAVSVRDGQGGGSRRH